MAETCAAYAVECEGITKTYLAEGAATPALQGVNLKVKRGELLMLVGPSGCGKTTLLCVIAGILNHDAGSCLVFDRDLQALSDNERTAFRGANIGFVFQSYNLIPTLSVEENVSIPLLIAKWPQPKAVARAREVLELAGLADRRLTLPFRLSGGQQQRVAIARALVHNPGLIVCDEPTSALDQHTGHDIMELFRSVVLQNGRSLIVVTHDSRILSFADRIAAMNDGVIDNMYNSVEEMPLH